MLLTSPTIQYKRKYILRNIILFSFIIIVILSGIVYFRSYISYSPLEKFVNILPHSIIDPLSPKSTSPITNVSFNNISSKKTININPDDIIIIRGEAAPNSKILLTIPRRPDFNREIIVNSEGKWRTTLQNDSLYQGTYILNAQIFDNNSQQYSKEYKIAKFIIGFSESQQSQTPILLLFIISTFVIILIITYSFIRNRSYSNNPYKAI